MILSNGVDITCEDIECRKMHDIHVMISLDGVNSTNDQQRKFIDGSGTLSNGSANTRPVARNEIETVH